MVVASFAAFFVTQRLKHTPGAIDRFEMQASFDPQARWPLRLEDISLRITRDDRVTVTIVDSAGEDVATLVRDRPLAKYTWLRLRWNGRRGRHGNGAAPPTGRLAAAGEYRVRVQLAAQKRAPLLPRGFQLVRPPRPLRTLVIR